MKTYKLKISPLFKDDLKSVSEYISKTLKNPQAAKRLVIETRKAIRERLAIPLAAEPYCPESTNRIFYRIYVGNYTVFYVVNDNTMEVRRFLYSARDFNKLL
ncbi:MAG: type II toxin-antitoxin system RelE/ParE family toxin [Oscillospiraceae bacterium]|nr:type II toxin-antitoxin system RelE/ParE family toxin [Oscillospiraceae bacterium]